MNDKRKLRTFKEIMKNNSEDIFAQSDARIKERHGGFTIKLSKIESEINNDDTNSIFDSNEKFYDAVNELDDNSLKNSNRINNTNKYIYFSIRTCLESFIK